MERAIPAQTKTAKSSKVPARPVRTIGPESHHSLVDHNGAFHHTLGNRTLLRLQKAGKLQAALKTGRPNDVYEQEADRVADQVLRMPDPAVQPKQNAPIAPRSRKKNHSPIKVSLKTDAAAGTGTTVPDTIVSALGPGYPMDSATRGYFEPRFGVDLSRVRLHTDSRAAESAKGINAKAFTLGNNIVFGPGRFQPETSDGKRLLAHEITHVMQQNSMLNFSNNLIQAVFEDEPISAGSNADTLATRIQGILREWKSECQEGVNDFVHAELAARIDSMGSGSWPNFVVALIGNTIWAAAAFVPMVGWATTVARIALGSFALSMVGIAVNAAPGIPSASSESANLGRISLYLKDYFGTVFTGLMNQVPLAVTQWVARNGTQTGLQSLIRFLVDNFPTPHINITGTPNINGNAVRNTTRRTAADLLNRHRSQVIPIGSVTTRNRTDPVDRQERTQTGVAWATHDNGTNYLVLIDVTNSDDRGPRRPTSIVFVRFIDSDLRQAAIERATAAQPRGIQTIPWSMIRGIPGSAPTSTARQ